MKWKAMLPLIALFMVGPSKNFTAAQAAKVEALEALLGRLAPKAEQRFLQAVRANDRPEMVRIIEGSSVTPDIRQQLLGAGETSLSNALRISQKERVEDLGDAGVRELSARLPSEELKFLKEGLCLYLENSPTDAQSQEPDLFAGKKQELRNAIKFRALLVNMKSSFDPYYKVGVT